MVRNVIAFFSRCKSHCLTLMNVQYFNELLRHVQRTDAIDLDSDGIFCGHKRLHDAKLFEHFNN